MPLPIRAIRQQFDPRRIANSVLWLDSTDSSTQTMNGSTVSQWSDKSGRGNHATQTTAASQPTRAASGINGRQTITFSGTTSVRVSLSLTLPYTIVAVGKLSTNNGGYQRLVAGLPDVHLVFGAVNGNYSTFFGSGSAWNDITANSPSRSVMQNRIMSVSAGTSTATPYIDGEALNTKTSTGSAPTSLAIGGVFTGQFWQGECGDVLIYSRALSADELRWLHIGLSRKWSIPLA